MAGVWSRVELLTRTRKGLGSTPSAIERKIGSLIKRRSEGGASLYLRETEAEKDTRAPSILALS